MIATVADTGDTDGVAWASLGGAIRGRRHDRGLTLLELASQVDLSQPFLSQIENGRARPSMSSLYRIAHALGTTPQFLFGDATTSAAGTSVRRAGEAPQVALEGGATASAGGAAACRMLLTGDAPFHVLEFDGLPSSFLEPWQHEGFEAIFVIEGDVEVEVGGVRSLLGAGDFLSYSSRLPHRHRAASGRHARVLLMETRLETVAGHPQHSRRTS